MVNATMPRFHRLLRSLANVSFIHFEKHPVDPDDNSTDSMVSSDSSSSDDDDDVNPSLKRKDDIKSKIDYLKYSPKEKGGYVEVAKLVTQKPRIFMPATTATKIIRSYLNHNERITSMSKVSCGQEKHYVKGA